MLTPSAARRRRRILACVGAFTAFLLVFGAFFYFFGGWNANAPADLTICNGDEPQSLDPGLIVGQLEERICQALFEGLVTRRPDGGLIPGMAESWEISPDGRTYTFHLRANAKWSDGAPVTANDFLASWQRVLEPATASEYAYQLYYLANGEAYGTGKLTDFSQVGVKAPDPRTLVVTLTHPTAYFLELTTLSTLAPVRVEEVKKYGNDWTKPGRLISNGPYVLREWRLNDYILLEANPNYWRPVPIRRIKVLPTNNATAAYNLFYSGKTDLLIDKSSIPADLLDDLKTKPYFHANPFGATAFMRFNVKRKPFDDVRVRQALALALDKGDIVRKITRAGEPVANAFVPPGYAGYTGPTGLGYNVEQARQLLAAAGYPGGRGFPDVTILYAIHGAGPEAVATEMQALWKNALGITTIHIRGEEWKTYLNTQSLVDFDLCFSSWVGDYGDPQTFLDMFVTDGGNNNTGWSNARYDQLLQDSESTPDPAQRMKLLHDMEQMLVEQELPIFPVYFYVGLSLYHPDKLAGFAPNVVDEHPWNEFYVPGKKP